MNTDVETAFSTLQADPQAKGAWEALDRSVQAASNGQREGLAQALAAARAWHLDRGEVEAGLALIARELAVAPEETQADLLAEQARLLFSEFCRCEAARTFLKQALELAPAHAAARKLTDQIDAEEATWEATAQAKLQEAKNAGTKPSAGAPYAAAGELYLKYRPRSSEGEVFLRRAIEADPRQRRADLLLERQFRADGRLEELAALLNKRIAAAANGDERALAEVLAARVAAERGQPDEAFEHYRRALAANPAEPRALATVGAALTAREDWAELAKIYEAALRAAKRGAGELALLVPLATIAWKRLGNLEQAELHFRRLKKLDPQNPAILDFYRDFHTRRNEIPQLLALLAQAQKSETDPDRRVRIGVEMAEIAEQRPQSLEKAIDIWKGLLRIRPGLPEATAALRRLYTKTEKWNALLEMLKDDLEALPAGATEEKVARYLEMVPIYRDRLRLDVMVTNTYNAVLALRPDHPEALAALAQRHETNGRWADLVDILQRQVAASSDVETKIKLLQRIAALWSERLGKQQHAVAALEKVLALDPSSPAARATLRELHTRTRAWRPLLELLRTELPLVEGEKRRAHLADMAQLATDKLADGRQAIELWNEVLSIAPGDAEALEALAALYEREKRWAALAEVMGRLALVAGEGTDAGRGFLERRAEILHERLKATDAAEEGLRRILASDPGNVRVIRALRDIYADTRAYDKLEALYADRGAYEELCDTLTTVVDRLDDAEERTLLLERVAEVAKMRLGQPERALKAFEKVLATDPKNRRAARALVALYRDTDRWARLLSTYEILLGEGDGAPSVEERLAIFADARRISEERLGSKGLAFQWCARAYELSPEDPAIFAELERLGRDADEWGRLAELYARRLDGGAAGDERKALLRRLVRITRVRLERPIEARRYAEELLTLEPGDDEAELVLEKIFTEGEDWPSLVAILHRRAAKLVDGGPRTDLLVRIAEIEETKLQDRAAAAKTLRGLAERDATSARVLAALARNLEALGEAKELVEVLKRQAALGLDDDRGTLLLKLADLEESLLDDPLGASEAYLQVLEIDPVSERAVAGLERLTAAKSLAGASLRDALQRLIPYYELTESYEKWAGVLERLVTLEETDADRLARLEVLVDLYGGPLAKPRAAFDAALKVFETEPRNYAHHRRLLPMALDAAALDDLLRSLRKVLRETKDPVLRRELLGIVAEAEDRGGPGGAGESERVYRELLEVDPLHFGAFRALTRFYRDEERWKDLRALVELRQAHVPETKERLTLLWQIAEIDETLLEDPEHAIATLDKILELEPSDLRVFRTLERHYASANRWSDLEGLLAKLVHIVPPGELVEVKFRRADVAQRRLGQSAHAIDILEEVLTVRPQHEGARRLLEEILDVADQRQRAAAILEPLYEAAGEWERLVGVLDVQREAHEGLAAIELLSRMADIQEVRLADRAAAFGTWRRVLELDPRSARALAEAERLATALARFHELVALYEALADKADPADLSIGADLLGRAARLQLSEFGDRDAAIATWRRVLDLDPTNVETARPAVEALEELYGATGNFRGLVETLRAKVEWADDDAGRTTILARVADLEEKSLGDLGAAVITFRSILDHDPESRLALDELERLFETLGQHRERVEILRRKVELETTSEAREALRFRIATILDRDLQDVDEAISTTLAILDESPTNRAALEALARLYERKGATNERLEILDRQLVLTSDADAKVEILRGMAELLAGPLGRLGDALERWREILALAPRDPSALGRLEGVLDQDTGSLRLSAAEALEPLYEAAGEWPSLARVIEIYIAAEEDTRARMNHRVRLAELQELRLGNRAAALASYGEAIRDALGEPQLAGLLGAYERLADGLGGDHARSVVRLFREIEPDVLSDDLKLQIAQTIARRAQAEGDLSLATECYRKILDRRPDDLDVLGALEGLHRQSEELPALLEILQRRAELLTGTGAELSLRLQIGQLAIRLSRTDDAVAAYERVWTLSPGESEAQAALERIYTETRQWRELADLLERQLANGRLSPDEGTVLRLRIARLQLDELGERDRALDQIEAALKSDPTYGDAIGILERLLEDPEARLRAADLLEPIYVRSGDWKRLVGIDEMRIEHTEDPTKRLQWIQRIARVSEEQMEDMEAAFRWHARAFRERPLDRGAQEPLLRIAPKVDRWKDVAQLLGDFLETESGNSDEILELVRLAAIVCDERIGDRDMARHHYRRFMEAQPGEARAARLFEQALGRWEAWDELRDLLEEQAARTPAADERISFFRRSARISEEQLEDRTRAVESLRAVLELEPMDLHAAQEIERLLRADQRWSDLREHLLWMLDRAGEQGDQNAIAFSLGDIEENRLEMVASAVERYGEILGRTPRHAGSLVALERLLTHRDQRHRVAEILEPHFRRMHEWRKLADVLEVLLEETDSVDRRVTLLQEIAALEERMARADRAIEARGRAWLEDVTARETLAQLEEVASAGRLFARYAEILREGAELAVDPDLQANLSARRAKLLENRLGEPGRAIEAWRATLDARPDDEEAFVALERLLAQAGRSAELCDTLEKHIEVARAADARKGLSKRLAVLLEESGRQDRAIEAWRAVLDIDHAETEALDALLRLYEASEEWRDLAEVYQRKIELEQDGTVLRGLRFASARLYDERLLEPVEAASQLRAVLDASPGDAEALELLDRIFTREEQHGELLDVLDRRAAGAPSPTERDELAFRAAELLSGTLGDVQGAVDRHRDILARSPRHAGARQALWTLARQEEHRAHAAAVLDPVLRAQADWQELVALLELRLEAEEALGTRLDLLADIATVEETHRHDNRAAFGAWARAFREEPTEKAPREALERLAAELSDFAGLAKVYEGRLEEGVDPDLQEQLAWRLADLHDRQLGAPERAVEFVRQVVDVPGQELRALARLDGLLRRLERWRDLEEVLAQQAELAPEPGAQADLLASLGEVRLTKLDDAPGAVEAFKGALDRVATHKGALTALRPLADRDDLRTEVLDVLEPLAEARGDVAEWAALLEIRARAEDDDSMRAALWTRVAELAERKLGDAPRAIQALGQALKADPYSPAVADDLERVAKDARAVKDAAAIFEGLLAELDGSAALDFSLRAARLYEAQPGGGAEQDAAAERLYRRVLDEDAENASALEALEALYRRQGNDLKLAEALEQRAGHEFDPRRRETFYGEAARIHEKRGNVDAAIRDWQAVRDGDEESATALAELSRLFELQGRTADLVAVLEAQTRFAEEKDARVAFGLRMAQLKGTVLGDEEGAAAAFRDVLDVDPSNPTALDALGGIEERRGDFAAVEDILLRRLSASTGADRVPVLLQLARNADERLEDTDRAIGYLQEILGSEKANRAAYAELDRILRRAERWHDLADLLERRAGTEAQADPEAEITSRLALAELWAQHLGDESAAAETIEKILERHPGHGGALLALAGLRERAEQWDEAAQVLEGAAAALAKAGASASERAEVQFRRGRVLAARGAAAADVEACYSAALEADPTHRNSIGALEQAARKSGNSAQLVRLLGLRERITDDASERKALLAERAKLYLGPLSAPAEAVAVLEQLSALAPSDATVKEDLARALAASGRADQAEAILGPLVTELAKAKQLKAVGRVQQLLGSFAEARGDVAAATERFKAAYQVDPTNAATVASLGRLAIAQNDADAARRYFRALLLQSFDEKAVGMTKAEVYLALGRLHLAANELPKARNMFERGLETDPQNAALRQMLQEMPRA